MDVENNKPVQLCPICQWPLRNTDKQMNDCPRCGKYRLSDDANTDFSMPEFRKELSEIPNFESALCHHVRRLQRDTKQPPLITTEMLLRFKDDPWLPPLPDQLNNLIRFLGEHSEPGGPKYIENMNLQFVVGASHPVGVTLLLKELEEQSLIIFKDERMLESPQGESSVTLTFNGWTKYEELRRGVATGRKAFMAMPFDTNIDNTWLPVAREAVKATGFELRRVDDQPEPGIIDNIMRVQIEEARFVIVELTHSNLGAYWEAGYAEGLQKPVIYTCSHKQEKIHFDTSHLTRIIWYEDELELAARQLKAMIRHILPDAIHED